VVVEHLLLLSLNPSQQLKLVVLTSQPSLEALEVQLPLQLRKKHLLKTMKRQCL
jgi:hypothetical protein